MGERPIRDYVDGGGAVSESRNLLTSYRANEQMDGRTGRALNPRESMPEAASVPRADTLHAFA